MQFPSLLCDIPEKILNVKIPSAVQENPFSVYTSSLPAKETTVLLLGVFKQPQNGGASCPIAP